MKYSSIDITSGKKQGFHLLNTCIDEAKTPAAVGRAGDALVPLTPTAGMATSRHMQWKKSCIQDPSGSFWLPPYEALISKCLTNKGLSLVPDIAVTQLTTLSWSTGCLLAGKGWHRLSREYGKPFCQMMGHSSRSKEPQFLAEELKTFCSNLFVFLPRERFWMQFPAKPKFLLEVFLLIICVNVEGGPLRDQLFKQQQSWNLQNQNGNGVGERSYFLDGAILLQRDRQRPNDGEMPQPTGESRSPSHPEHILLPIHTRSPFPAHQRSGHEGGVLCIWTPTHHGTWDPSV